MIDYSVSLLRKPFSGVRFEHGDQSLAVALGMMIAIKCRPVLPSVPIFPVTSGIPGSGKGTLVKICIKIAAAEGEVSRVLCADKRESEMEAGIDGALISGERIILVDNVPEGAVVKSVPMATLVSDSEFADVRVYGKNDKKVRVYDTRVFIFTGTNINLGMTCARPKRRRPRRLWPTARRLSGGCSVDLGGPEAVRRSPPTSRSGPNPTPRDRERATAPALHGLASGVNSRPPGSHGPGEREGPTDSVTTSCAGASRPKFGLAGP